MGEKLQNKKFGDSLVCDVFNKLWQTIDNQFKNC